MTLTGGLTPDEGVDEEEATGGGDELHRELVGAGRFSGFLGVVGVGADGRSCVGLRGRGWGSALAVDFEAEYFDVPQWEDTMARHNRLQATGLLVLPVSPGHLRRRPEEVNADVRKALASGLHGPLDLIAVAT